MSRTRRSGTWGDVRAELLSRPQAIAAFEARFPFANVADAVLELRVSRALTQKDLAVAVGTSQSVIARLESGRHPVEVRLLNRIATALGMKWHPVFESSEASSAVRNIAFPANVVPLFGPKPAQPVAQLRNQIVRPRESAPDEVVDALEELQAQIEQVKGMVSAALPVGDLRRRPKADAG